MLSRCAPCEQKNRYVAASDEQQQRYGSKEQVQRASKALEELIVQSLNGNFEVLGKMRRSFFCKLLEERMKFAVGCCMRHARLQSDHRHHGSRRIVREFPRQVNVAIAPGEAWSCNSDNGVALVRQLDCLAQYTGIGVVVALPELVSENGHGLRILSFRSVSGKNSAAKQCGNSEMSECVSREVDCGDVFW